MTTTRPYADRDHADVLALADRLVEGRPPWRDGRAWLDAVRGWVADSVASADDDGHAAFVADVDGEVAGFVSVTSRRHFTGQTDAYVGELVVSRDHERSGVGSALLTEAERWAAEQGLRTVTLETGAANRSARLFYAAAGFLDEDVRLTKVLG